MQPDEGDKSDIDREEEGKMERMRKFFHVAILPCLVALMFGLFTVQASAATIRIEVRNVTEASSTVTKTDGVTCSVEFTPSAYYTYPKQVVVQNSTGEIVPVSYDPKTGKLNISGDYVYGNLTVTGEAVQVQPIGQPSIEGLTTVGETLTVKVSPADADVSYQWYKVKNGVRTAIGNSSSYELTTNDVGYTIDVIVINNLYDKDKKTASVGPVEKRKALDVPSSSDVTITHVNTNGGKNGIISPNTDRVLQYYDKTQKDWIDLKQPIRNLVAGEYQIRFKATDIFKESEPIIVTVMEPCSSPVATDVTITNLTEAGASTGKLAPNTSKPMEYSMDGVTWELLPVSGLKAGKYQVRFQATIAYLQSAPTNFFVMEPTKLVITPADVAVTHVTVKGAVTGVLKPMLTNAPTMEVLVDGIWKTLPLRNVKAGTYQVRYAATETTFASASCNVVVKEPADAPTGIRVSDVPEHGGNTGSISGLKTAWQVSYDGKTWNDCTQTTLSGLRAGAYYFRTKETDSHLPSEAVKCYVKQPDETPQATIDFVNGTLKNLVANAEYLIDNNSYKALANGTISILENDLAGRSIALKRKGDGETTLDSAKQTVNIPARPNIPGAPAIVGKTDTTVTVTLVGGLEYSIDGKTWRTATDAEYTFSGLKANTAYTVYARVKAVEGKSFCSANAGTNVTTKKSSSDAVRPVKAIVSLITDTTITVDAVSGQEYRLNNGDWIRPDGSTCKWTGLKQATAYTVYTRTAETADTMPSTHLTTNITTYTKHTLGSVKIDFYKMAIIELTAGRYSINSGVPMEVGKNGLLNVEDYFGRTIQLRRVGSAETKTVDSDPLTVNVFSPIAAPTADQLGIDSIRPTLTGFIVSDPDARLEYQILDLDGFPVSEWKSSANEEIVFDGLQHSTAYLIQVSYKPTATDPKSNAYISDPIYTLFYEEVPTAGVDTVAHCLTDLTPGASYLINGMRYTASEKGTVTVSDMWIDSEILIVKCGDGKKSVDSVAQSLLLPGRVPTQVKDVKIQPVTYYDGSNGVITGVTGDMEYSADGGKTWSVVNGDKLDGLTVSEYQIRYRAQAGKYFAGEKQSFQVGIDETIAQYKQQVIEQLEATYKQMEESRRYNVPQLEQLRAILDHGIENINVSMTTVSDVDNAKNTVLNNMELVPCSNISTVDGKLVGEEITSDNQLQYPKDGNGNEIWGNVSNEDGLDSNLILVIGMLGKSDTEALDDQFRLAVAQGTVMSADGTLSAQSLTSLLYNTEVKLGMEITINRETTPTDQFKGVYRVTMLLPVELQGQESLNIISVAEDGSISYHPATVTGNYLTFETTHFSTYGVIGEDALAVAKEETLNRISDLSEKTDPNAYTRDNWEKVQAAFLGAINKVTDAKTVDEVEGTWAELLACLDQMPMKRALGWLWLLMLLLVLIIALIIVCYFVWQVHYFDGEEQIHKAFHFWGTRVKLWIPEKDGFVLAGWYYDPELTDPAEDEFKMPWHSVKLYVKWNMIEILHESEEDTLTEESAEDICESEKTETVDGELTTLDAFAEEHASEEEYLSEAEEDVSEDDLAELALLDAPAEENEADESDDTSENELPLLDAAENEGVALLEASDDSENEKTALLTSGETAVAALPEASESDVALLEASEQEEMPMLEAPAQEGHLLPAVVVGDIVDEAESDDDASADEDGYKDSDSYRAWLLFGDGENEQAPNEEKTQLEDGDEVQLFINEKTGEKYHIRFNLSFRAKMTSLSEEAKSFYRELKDEFLSYKGVKTRISWKAEAVRKGRETIARFAVRDRTLCVFLALDPDAYRDSKYVFESVQDVKAYEAVPMLIRVKSDLSCRKVKELIADMMEPRDAKRLDTAPETDYSYLDEDSSTEARLRAGQLRIWAEGPDDQVCANRAAAATLHYLISPEATAEEAEALISDEMLDALMPPAQDILIVPDHVGEVSVEQLCKKFYEGDVIDISAMKEKGLLDPEVNYVKITSAGDMTKKLTVSAHMFERTAAKMILLTGGDIEMITE